MKLYCIPILFAACLLPSNVAIAEDEMARLEQRLAAIEAKLAAAEKTTTAATAPSVPDTQLRAALQRIKELEQKVNKLEAAQAANATKSKSDRSSGKAIADILPANSSGKGEYYNHNSTNQEDVSVNVSSREGDRAVLQITLPNSGQAFQVKCKVKGNQLSVYAVEQTSPPRGAPKFIVSRVESGTGSVQDGVLSLSWSVRGSSPPALANNREWHVALKNVNIE